MRERQKQTNTTHTLTHTNTEPPVWFLFKRIYYRAVVCVCARVCWFKAVSISVCPIAKPLFIIYIYFGCMSNVGLWVVKGPQGKGNMAHSTFSGHCKLACFVSIVNVSAQTAQTIAYFKYKKKKEKRNKPFSHPLAFIRPIQLVIQIVNLHLKNCAGHPPPFRSISLSSERIYIFLSKYRNKKKKMWSAALRFGTSPWSTNSSS